MEQPNKGIRISSFGKGLFAYEDALIQQHLKELNHWMFEHDIPVVVRNVIRAAHKDVVVRDTVKWMYMHPIREFFACAIHNDYTPLYRNTSRVVIPEKDGVLFPPLPK